MVTVFEVDFEARFEIRLLEPGLGLIGPESSGFDQVREKGITQKAGFEVKGDGKCQDEKNRDLIDKNENPCEKLDKGSHVDAINGGGVVINATMLKYGVVSHLSHIWKVDIHGKKPKFEHILTSTMAKEALRGGFVVKKLERKKLEGNMELELEESEEFEIKVPQGSVLLFPSQNAIGVDELKSMHFEVKNLIVLDGTWSKAGRIYNENPWLKLLPHLRLDLDRMSLYSEIRSQPKVGCLSTIESIVYSLKALGEKVDGLENLLDVFESMVGDQRRLKDERTGITHQFFFFRNNAKAPFPSTLEPPKTLLLLLLLLLCFQNHLRPSIFPYFQTSKTQTKATRPNPKPEPDSYEVKPPV